jgi:hypothetical protein
MALARALSTVPILLGRPASGHRLRDAPARPGYRAPMPLGRARAARPQDTVRLMTVAAGVVTAASAAVGLARGDGELLAVAAAFAGLTLHLYARYRDVAGTGSPLLTLVALLVCATACVGLAMTGYWFFAACLLVPVVFGVLRLAGPQRT